MTACAVLFERIDKTLVRNGQFLYAVFVDFRAAFDSGSRRIVIDRLAEHGVPRNVLELVKKILQENTVTIEDGVAKHEGVTQTNGFAQGDNLSPMLCEVIMYADDLVVVSNSRFHVRAFKNAVFIITINSLSTLHTS